MTRPWVRQAGGRDSRRQRWRFRAGRPPVRWRVRNSRS